MKNILKSWKTTVIGVIALIGLAYNMYTSGGIDVIDFLALAVGIGFIAAEDGTNNGNNKNIEPNAQPNPDHEEH